jgi:pyruvate formate lyase activating enzyme
VTFSGGEPLVHARYLGSVGGILADTGVHVALETSLAVRVPESEALPEGLLSLASRVPLWLVDLKHPEAAEYRRVTGVSQSILTDNLALLRRAGAEVIPRLVLVPGVTDTDSSLSALSLLCADAGFSRVEFLPYNPPPGADALGLPVTGTDPVAFERARRLLEHRE